MWSSTSSGVSRVLGRLASALRAAEQNWFTAIPARLDAAAMDRVLALVGWGEDTQGEETEDEPEDPESVLALIKSMPVNVSLVSMLTEIRKLKAARGIGLPARLFSDAAPKVVAGWRVASDSTHFRTWDQNLFTEWHARYGGGVLVYWHVEDRYVVVHSQVLKASASEVAAIVEGAVRHGTTMNLAGARTMAV